MASFVQSWGAAYQTPAWDAGSPYNTSAGVRLPAALWGPRSVVGSERGRPLPAWLPSHYIGVGFQAPPFVYVAVFCKRPFIELFYK